MNRTASTGLVLAMALLLGGCSLFRDDDKSSDNKASLGIDIKGLAYSSESYSGYTSDSGGFKYRSGEKIEFSVGNTVIASVTALENDSFAALFEQSLPSDQSTFTKALAFDAAPQFHRMANAMALLMMLDEDQNPDNGIDLSQWQGSNVLPQLDLDQNLYHFFYLTLAQLAESKGITRQRLTVSEPVNLIYSKAGKEFSAQALSSADRTSYQYDLQGRLSAYNDDVYTDTPITLSYTDSGHIASVVVPEATLSYSTLHYSVSYDSDNRVITKYKKFESALFEYDDNGFIAAITEAIFGPINLGNFTYQYFADENQTRQERDSNFDGVIDEITLTASYFNAAGLLSLSEAGIDDDADGTVDQQITESYTYNSTGNLSEYSFQSTDTESAAVTKQVDRSYSYHPSGKQETFSERTQYSSNDWQQQTLTYSTVGQLLRSDASEGEGDTLSSRSLKTCEYDAQGNQTYYLYTRDSDGDGVADRTELLEKTYSLSGQLLTANETIHTDGESDSIETRTLTYNAQGQLTLEQIDSDEDGDGVMENTTAHTYTYKADGLLETLLTETTSDGVLTYSETETNIYTEGGLVSAISSTFDIDGDGVIDSRSEILYSYVIHNAGPAYLIENNIPAGELLNLNSSLPVRANDFWISDLGALIYGESLSVPYWRNW